jgi:NAD-dependent SIR2 family protein deacetylase
MVWLGESIKQQVWKKAVKQSMTCDVMIIAGKEIDSHDYLSVPGSFNSKLAD